MSVWDSFMGGDRGTGLLPLIFCLSPPLLRFPSRRFLSLVSAVWCPLFVVVLIRTGSEPTEIDGSRSGFLVSRGRERGHSHFGYLGRYLVYGSIWLRNSPIFDYLFRDRGEYVLNPFRGL